MVRRGQADITIKSADVYERRDRFFFQPNRRLKRPKGALEGQLFLDLIDATADILITAGQVVVKFRKRSHNPLLIAAGFDKTDVVIPWLGGKRLRLISG